MLIFFIINYIKQFQILILKKFAEYVFENAQWICIVAKTAKAVRDFFLNGLIIVRVSL